MENQNLTISVSPHIKDSETTARIIWSVNLALAPAAIMGVYYFGLKAILTMMLSIVSAILSEYLFQKFSNKKITINDGSAFLTGLLLGMNLPPAVPFYIPILGSFVAIILTKQLFGGLGFNIFNPALVGRAFLLISFPRILTTWNSPVSWNNPTLLSTTIDATTCATPLNIMKMEGVQKLIEMFGSKIMIYEQLLIGHRGGSIGETCIIALLIGALFLLIRGYITWQIPTAYIGTAAILAWIFGDKDIFFAGNALIHVLSGGLVLGAFFMATDYITSPVTKAGQILFGIGCGFFTMLIRLKGGYPEGVMFSILIMNCFVPLIDRGFRPKLFGYNKKVVKK